MAVPLEDVFQANGSDSDKALLLASLRKIYFPWEVLLPGLKAAGLSKIQMEFADLSSFGVLLQTATGERLTHATLASQDDDEDTHFHAVWADQVPGLPGETRRFVAGLAYHGKLQVEQKLKSDPATVDVVCAAETAHEIDFFLMDISPNTNAPGGVHDQLLHLLYGGEPQHPWWWGNYNSPDYWSQPGESWMNGWTLAYSDFAVEDPRFTPYFRRAQAADIRKIVKLERTDATTLPPTDALAMAREVIARTNAERAKAGALPLVLRSLSNGTLPAGQEISWTCLEGRIARIERQIGSEIPLAAMGALVEHNALMKAAQDFAVEMVRTGKLDHTGEGGTSPGDRMAKAGYKNFKTWGENIARGFSTPEAVMLAWMNSAGHRANILNPAFVHIGVGYQAGVWVMDLAAGDGDTLPPASEIKLNKLTPDQGGTGALVTADGQGFGTAAAVVVTIKSGTITTIYRLPESLMVRRSDTEVRFKLPFGVTTGPVYLRNGLKTSNALTFTVATAPPPPPPPPPPANGQYQLVLMVKATQTATGWDWTSNVTTTASTGLDVNEAQAALIRQGIAALQKALEGLP